MATAGEIEGAPGICRARLLRLRVLPRLRVSVVNLIPEARPTTEEIFGSIEVDYKLALNAVALVAFAALIYLTVRRGVTDPVCGMKVDRAKALHREREGRAYFFCSEHCRDRFEADPQRFANPSDASAKVEPAGHAAWPGIYALLRGQASSFRNPWVVARDESGPRSEAATAQKQ